MNTPTNVPYSLIMTARAMGRSNSLQHFMKHVKIKGKRHALRCATCNKFISSNGAIWYSPIEGMPREPYHSDCPKP